MKEVTVCITACNRFELLCRTLDTFFEFNTYPIKNVYVIEDSGKTEVRDKIQERYGNKITLLFNEINLGQVASIDKMYELVDTEYIFHCEEDYIFYKSGFIENSITILDGLPEINQVWIRENMLTKSQSDHYLESEIKDCNGVKYKMVKSPNSQFWCGFSFNAGLKRKSDYIKMFPQGYKIYHNKEMPYLSEVACNTNAMSFGYRACQLMIGYCDTESYETSSYKDVWVKE
jgi:hypothetical protein